MQMGLSYLSNQYWLPGSTDSDCMLHQSLDPPQELELDLDHLVCLPDDFTLADTSIDPLFFNPSQPQPTFISQSQPPQLTTAYNFDRPQQDFQHHQQQQCYYSNNKRQKTTHYPNHNLQDEAIDPFFASQVMSQSTDEAWMLPDVTSPPGFNSGSVANSNSNCRCERRVGGGGGLSAESIAARQRRRKIADKTQELGKLIPGGHKMNTADMFHSASMYVNFLQAQIAILTLTNNSLQERGLGFNEEKHNLKHLVDSPKVQEKLYSQEKCLAPHKLLQSLSNDSKLQSNHPSLVRHTNNLVKTPHGRPNH